MPALYTLKLLAHKPAVTMSTFFNSFTGFAYNPAAPKEDEFNRLRDVQGWNPSSLDFRAQYKAFRTALVKETGAAVDLFFRNEYTSPHFTYRTNASPWSEFRRLMRCPGAVVGSSEWAARARFTVVFNEAFSRQIDIFFQQFSQFEYNPKEEPKAEFERLRKFKKWFFRLDDERPDELAQYEKARAEFFDAFIADFTYFFGVGEDIRDWEYLCDVLHISPMPKTPEACQVVCMRSIFSWPLAEYWCRQLNRTMSTYSTCTTTYSAGPSLSTMTAWKI